MTQIQTQLNTVTRPDGPASDLPELLASVLADAVGQGATDIHIDTWGERAAVRFRVDGVIPHRTMRF
jgi:type II secretory ATPase GspE/PulE/Tfp pilus assembly ATPase PilB-like protein